MPMPSHAFSGEEETPLDHLDRVLATLSPGHPARADLTALRVAVTEQESTMAEARQAIEKMEAIISKLTAPANRIGTFLGIGEEGVAQIVVGGADYYCNIDPRLSPKNLQCGTRVLVNEAFVIVGDLGYGTAGPVAKVSEVLESGRLRVGSDHGLQNVVLERGAALSEAKVRSGDEIRVDANYRVALELLARGRGDDYYLEKVPELPWEKVGGQHEALEAIRDAVELPLLHADLFRQYRHGAPKGFLLYGPPGCGKTLIGKATAWNLTRQLAQQRGGDGRREYFMHIKGPEILNMWVGESERIVREIFATAREKRCEGFLPFLFIDEAESILGTRRATRQSNILSTLVPMFCTEMDGIDSLGDVVIILASNRADLIDPAILRPGRIDRKIKVNRPTPEGAREIYRIYLDPQLPYAPELLEEHGDVNAVIEALIESLVRRQYSRDDGSRFLEVILRSGRRDVLYRGDLVSGAIIASIVERAKGLAIKRAIRSGDGAGGISEADLLASLDAEYRENDLFPPAEMTEDWLKLIDYDPENVVRIAPARARTGEQRPLGDMV